MKKRQMWWGIGLIILMSLGQIATGAENYAASISRVEMPDNLTSGERFSIELRIRNNGTRALSSANQVSLFLNTNSRGWADQEVSLGNLSVKPGQTELLKLRLNAPTTQGIFRIDWRLRQAGKDISDSTQSRQVTVESASNQVQFISQVIPENMQAGERRRVIVQYRNKGHHVWSSKGRYRLGFIGNDARVWGLREVDLAENDVVPPGETASFRFDIEAPKKPGQYKLQWRLLKNKNEWFGEPSPESSVTISQGQQELDAEFMHQVLPKLRKSNNPFTIFKRGQVYPVTITYKNIGSQPWLPGIYHLAAIDKKSELVWSVARIDLKPNEVIHSGQIKTFNFQVIAPLDPGIYDFQWRLKKGNNTWVGETTEKVSVTVQ